jgi:hypothetical protein
MVFLSICPVLSYNWGKLVVGKDSHLLYWTITLITVYLKLRTVLTLHSRRYPIHY